MDKSCHGSRPFFVETVYQLNPEVIDIDQPDAVRLAKRRYSRQLDGQRNKPARPSNHIHQLLLSFRIHLDVSARSCQTRMTCQSLNIPQ